MRSRGTAVLLALLMCAVMAGLTTSARADLVSNANYYANQTPYGNPASTQVKAPPAGYELLFLETVGRHGSRTLTSDTVEDRALALWQRASSQGKLTTLGTQFDNDLAAFRAVEQRIGYGNLSARGKDELRGFGRRTAVNYAGFFTRAAAKGDKVQMRVSGVYRTLQSARYMRETLGAKVPGLDFAARVVDERLLIESGSTRAGRAAIAANRRQSSVLASSKHLLERIYRPSFVDGLSDPVAAALDVYALYATAPGLKGDTTITFANYVPIDDARRLAMVKDTGNFYRYGPGVAGQVSSYTQAKPVLADFFARLDQRIAGGRTAAVFRHGHGETTMPFGALIKVPGSTKQALKSAPYTWGNNPWRGFVAGRLAGNIEWAAYRKGGAVLVTMRHNEQPAKFASACTPVEATSYFYRLGELKSCLG
ncbi:histidine-type phosphatase [Aeromicrobium sp.]|uniref:histidine-type phosphatase n=1 Tax=Aeromicrobium sp. TaxID=1871063 RepID=UPI0030BDDB54